MKEFSCRDIGRDCDWSTTAVSDEEILKQAFKHDRREHNIHDFSETAQAKVRSQIFEVGPLLLDQEAT
jgi:predicted small metal-binding protein